MRSSLAGIVLLALLSFPSSRYGNAAEPDEKSDRPAAERIVRNDLIPHYLTSDGFKVPPQKIDYEQFPKLKPLLDRWPTLWKTVQPVLANEYEKRQREVNDKKRPDAQKWRKILKDSFQKACELRGGGSETAALYDFSGAQTEWLISQCHPVSDSYPSNNDVAVALKKDFEDLSQHDLADFQKVAAKLSEIDRFLPKPEAAFIRKEFLAYFQ